MLGDLYHAEEACGRVVSGGTEANLIALLAARTIGFGNGIRNPEVIAPKSIHFSIEKAAYILGIKLILTAVDHNYKAIVSDIEEHITPNTVAIFATVGTSELGAIDDIQSIAELAVEHDIYFHVDAATGGFFVPFMERKIPFDFSLDGVKSITVDPHKFGLTVIPAGYILFRNRELQMSARFESHYVGTKDHHTFTGTRPGAGVVSAFAVVNYFGRAGFERLTAECIDKRNYLIDELRRNSWNILIEPEMAIVAVKCDKPKEILDGLERQGWIASLSKRNRAIRIVIHHHLTKPHLAEFVRVLTQTSRNIK
jgi:tyrosine decarboxylase/aspartate 1-decarboxylase